MDKTEFVKGLVARLKLDPERVEAVVDSTLAEMIAPAIFGKDKLSPLASNNCDNRCGQEFLELARQGNIL